MEPVLVLAILVTLGNIAINSFYNSKNKHLMALTKEEILAAHEAGTQRILTAIQNVATELETLREDLKNAIADKGLSAADEAEVFGIIDQRTKSIGDAIEAVTTVVEGEDTGGGTGGGTGTGEGAE